MAKGKRSNVFSRGWRNLREAGTRRLVLTVLLLLLALVFARFSWFLPIENEGEPTPNLLTIDAELGLYDLRTLQLAPKADQDNRIVIVAYDDMTLINAQKRSPLDRGILTNALRVLDGVGAKSIGVDILFDQYQDEDADLIATLQGMKTPTAVAYVDKEINPEDVAEYEQQQYLDQFHAGFQGGNAFTADIRLSNAFGVTRIFPEILPEQPELISRAMVTAGGAEKLTLPGYEGSIDYRLCARCGQAEDSAEAGDAEAEKRGIEPLFPILPIDLFADPAVGALVAQEYDLADKFIIIGAVVVDVDRVNTTLSEGAGASVPGPTVHAEMIAQMLDGRARDQLSPVILWAFAVLFVLIAALTALLEWRDWKIYPLIISQFLLLLGVPFALQYLGADTYGLPAFGWLIGWTVAFLALTSAARASGAVQRNFAQGALGKYLPGEMAREIIDKPDLLALHGEKKEIYVLFSDLEGFTKMSHALSPEMVAKLLNRYLEMLSQVVLDHGGVIDKFVGDAVVAFWGAPISRDDDADRAAKAGYAIWQAGEAFREEVAAMDPELPPVGKTRVGLHFGEAVVGNFGGENRIQYTALGDSMNTAARLEAANKALSSSVMASREFADRTTLDWWRPMGKVVLRGRAKPVELMEPAPDFPKEQREKLANAMSFVATRQDEAIQVVEELIKGNKADKALANLLNRMNNLTEESVYVLG